MGEPSIVEDTEPPPIRGQSPNPQSHHALPKPNFTPLDGRKVTVPVQPVYAQTTHDLARSLHTSLQTGLDPSVAKERLEKYGRNVIDAGDGSKKWWEVLWHQVGESLFSHLLVQCADDTL